MRLYLSSFRIGDHPECLLALLAGTPGPVGVAVIANAMTPSRPTSGRPGWTARWPR